MLQVRALANADTADEQLLDQFVSRRDEAAFAALLGRHGAMVLAVCRRVLHDRQEAEDALQATFLLLARKAASIRKRESVGGWLHGVAFHVASTARRKQARRRVREKRVLDMRKTGHRTARTWEDFQEELDEALATLPEQQRAALVLCYLEGRTQEEAAQQLACPVGTVRSRLARGRRRLQAELARRGLALSAGAFLAAMMGGAASAALPRALTQATARVALGNGARGAVSPRVLALVEGGIKAMSPIKSKLALLVVVSASLAASLGGLAYRAYAGRMPEAATQQQLSAQPQAQQAAKPPVDAGPARSAEVAVRGIVLGADGKPFKGAKVYFNPGDQDDNPPIRASTGDDGRFEFRVRRDELASPRGESGRVVATGDGHGADWGEVPAEGAGELTLRLVKDDVPIQGRILTLEGKPVAGARVRVQWVRAYPSADLSPLLKAMEQRKFQGEYPQARLWWHRLPNQPKEVECDGAGRFRLSGVGREREVDLDVEGPGIQHWHITVYTRGMEPITPPDNPSVRHYGATFDHLVPPGRTITGVVREQGTRKPLAGVTVTGAGTLTMARTDAAGHYELPGCCKDKQYTLFASPKAGGLYFTTRAVVPDAAGLGPLTADLELARGIPFRGKVLDKETGKPVPAHAYYYPLHGNGNATSMELHNSAASHSAIAADGSFACTVLPGPGVIAVMVLRDRRDLYLPACIGPRELFKAFKVGTEERSPFGTRDILLLPQDSMAGWHMLAQNDFQAIVPVNPEKDEKVIERDLILERATRLTGSVVGPDGKPVAGARIAGLKEGQDWESVDGADFTMLAPNPLRPRPLVVEHPEKKLVGTLVVTGTEKGPLQVRLEAWAVVTGRLVIDGVPPAQSEIRFSGPNNLDKRAHTDKEGRFRVEGLIPGARYSAWVSTGGGLAVKDLTLRPGETKDLGTVAVGRPPNE
jgi:RNA polymerase sigma factor (sigma-70 family)